MSSDPRHPLVLIVDADDDTRELYEIMLASVGYRVDSAECVHAAIDMARRTTPHVVVTDWRLPDGDGLAMADALHERPTLRQVPLVAVSGMTVRPESVGEAHERGFVSMLVKPATPDEILGAVHFASEIAIARRLRAAAGRLRRYAAHAARHGRDQLAEAPIPTIDPGALVKRAAARSGHNIMLMLADDTARCVAAGGGTRELTGYDPQELLALSVWDVAPPPRGSSSRGLWRSFIASGTQEGRYTLRHRDGAAVEAQHCSIANIIPGVHVSAIAEASHIPAAL